MGHCGYVSKGGCFIDDYSISGLPHSGSLSMVRGELLSSGYSFNAGPLCNVIAPQSKRGLGTEVGDEKMLGEEDGP